MRLVALAFGAALSLFGMPASHALQHRSATLSIRTLANAPDRYADRKVTVTGRFRGRSADPDEPSTLTPLGMALLLVGAVYLLDGVMFLWLGLHLSRDAERARTGAGQPARR